MFGTEPQYAQMNPSHLAEYFVLMWKGLIMKVKVQQEAMPLLVAQLASYDEEVTVRKVYDGKWEVVGVFEVECDITAMMWRTATNCIPKWWATSVSNAYGELQ